MSVQYKSPAGMLLSQNNELNSVFDWIPRKEDKIYKLIKLFNYAMKMFVCLFIYWLIQWSV